MPARPSRLGLVLALGTLASTAAAQAPSGPSADWLARLPDGEEKRRFILDCTGCHQFDEKIARPNGRARTRAEWAEAVRRMLGYAGATTSFPVIAEGRDADATAAWLVAHLGEGDAAAAASAPVPATPASTAPSAVEAVREYMMPVPQDLPHDVAVDGNGQVLITGMFTHVIYRLDPATGAVTETAIPVPKANPRAIEVDAKGNWWVVLGGPNRIARYEPVTGKWTTWDVGMYAHSLGIAPDGRVWYNGHFTRAPELLGYVNPVTGEVRTVTVPAHPALAERPGGPIPYELRVAGDGRIWMSELQGNRLHALDPASGEFRTYEMPVQHSGPRRLDVAPDGTVWIPAYAANTLVRLDPGSGRFESFDLPIRDAVPYVVRVDPADGTVWVGTSAADAVLRFDPATTRWTTHPLPSRGALVRHLAIDPRTRDVWVAYGASPGIAARVARIRGGR